ncbi:MAG: AAA family ATPase [Pseudomonadota bacterium]|nr:AAA family ATPase [Pseudomonadota bacterium]
MTSDKVTLKNVKDIDEINVVFDYPPSNIIVITGKNGAGKTTLVKAFHFFKDPNIYSKSSGLNSVRAGSKIEFEIEGFSPFSLYYNHKLQSLDTKDELPPEDAILAELPIPYGERFSQFSMVAGNDSEIRANIAASDYSRADELSRFLESIYANNRFVDLQATKVNKSTYYFLLREGDFYIREDHFSSGEYFLVQIYRLITSGAKLILIDEVDVAIDAAAQVKLYDAIKSLLDEYGVRLILITHSLAFMSTVEDGGLYYLERNSDQVSLEQRSYGYIKSDLYGFKGFERYIITEDPVLEGFIKFIIIKFGIVPFYQYQIIGLGGVSQLKTLLEKNDLTTIFSDPQNIVCIVDGDSLHEFTSKYNGPTKVFSIPVEDIEKHIYRNRDQLLPEVGLPSYQESGDEKKASKSYWKYLTVDRQMSQNCLYELVLTANSERIDALVSEIRGFLINSDE